MQNMFQEYSIEYEYGMAKESFKKIQLLNLKVE